MPAKVEKLGQNSSWGSLDPKIIQKELRKRTLMLIASALGFFLALQYNEFLTEIIKKMFFFQPGNSVIGKLVYISILTVIIVGIIIFLERQS